MVVIGIKLGKDTVSMIYGSNRTSDDYIVKLEGGQWLNIK